jgi:hypothetical protein
MPPIEAEVSTMKGEIVAKTKVPEEPGDYSIGDSAFKIAEIIPGKKNGQETIKAVMAGFNPPYSDGRTQRFSFNGKPSEIVPPEAENTLAGRNYKARLRITKK